MEPAANSTRKWLDAAFAAVLVLLIVLLYRKTARLWWTFDDAHNIHLIVEHKLREFFADGALWPQKLFTPLEMVLFRAEASVLGLDPIRWYYVQLTLASAAALSVYAAARAFFSAVDAFVASLLFVAAVPLCSMTMRLDDAHYFVAIALGGAAVALYRRLPLVSALLYFAAMLAKEIAVPLVILLALLPGRKRALIPHGVAFAAYMLWRRLVLGTFFGGYGWVFQVSDLPSLPKKLFLGMAGASVAVGAVVVLLVILGAIAALRRNAILVLAALLITIGPIVPVSREMQRRFVLMPWMALAFAFVAGAETLPRRARAALLLAAPLLAIAANRQEWRQEFPRMKRMSDEARVFFDLPVNGLLRAPLVSPSAMDELNWLKTAIAGRPPGAGWFADDFYLCMNEVRGKRIWQFDAKAHRVVELATPIEAVKAKYCGELRPAPIAYEFRFRDDVLYWKFGPYADGTWRVLLADGVHAFDVPAREAFRLDPIPGMTLRIRYQSPAGWVAVSHPIALDFRRAR